MIRIRVTGFFQNPRKLWVSSGKRSQSATDGLRRHASTIPTTIPVRTSGYTRAIGDASIAAPTENGEPPAIAVNSPAPADVGMIHASIVFAKLSASFTLAIHTSNPRNAIGTAHFAIRHHNAGGGMISSFARSMS